MKIDDRTLPFEKIRLYKDDRAPLDDDKTLEESKIENDGVIFFCFKIEGCSHFFFFETFFFSFLSLSFVSNKNSFMNRFLKGTEAWEDIDVQNVGAPAAS